MRGDDAAVRPGELCRELLAALEASEGRRRRRKRDTTPDAIGLSIKRELLEAAVADDPAPEDFEGWLLDRCLARGPGGGAVRAMALSIWEEWRLVRSSPGFRAWLAQGAPSDDRDDASPACRAAATDAPERDAVRGTLPAHATGRTHETAPARDAKSALDPVPAHAARPAEPRGE
ncbi:MAG TPA: hypothetical protein VF212_06250 [Longimicrobiales bacterium]